jgi:hypothetical protein
MRKKKAQRDRKLSLKRLRELEGEYARLVIAELHHEDRMRREAMRLERKRKVNYVT